MNHITQRQEFLFAWRNHHPLTSHDPNRIIAHLRNPISVHCSTPLLGDNIYAEEEELGSSPNATVSVNSEALEKGESLSSKLLDRFGHLLDIRKTNARNAQ